MSFDIYLRDDHDETIEFAEPFEYAGGTYAVGGSHEAWLNITYNYAPILTRVLGGKSIRELEGQLAGTTLPLLVRALDQLSDDVDPDYWKPTEGNVKRAVQGLIAMASRAPMGRWHIT